MKIGISSYGAYVPFHRIKVEEIAKVWGANADDIKRGLSIEEKAVADYDEDTITMSVEAARIALLRAKIDPQKIGALYIGSESHPYAVKPSGTVVAEALGAVPNIMIADFEFACKAGTAAVQCCAAFAKAQEIEYGLAIGADTAQGRPGDALEYTAAGGAAAFIMGKNPVAELEGTYSYTTDTPDFWRREGESFPRHGARFTGEPAYFNHIVNASKNLMQKLGLKPSDIDYVALHTPNGKFPTRAAKILGLENNKLVPGLVVSKVGNTYSGASMLSMCAILDRVAKPGDRILMSSYGSGAGSDSFSFVVTDKIDEIRSLGSSIDHFINRKKYIDYGTYVKLRKKLKS